MLNRFNCKHLQGERVYCFRHNPGAPGWSTAQDPYKALYGILFPELLVANFFLAKLSLDNLPAIAYQIVFFQNTALSCFCRF